MRTTGCDRCDSVMLAVLAAVCPQVQLPKQPASAPARARPWRRGGVALPRQRFAAL